MAVGPASFLDILRQSRLLTPAQLDELSDLPSAQRADASTLARAVLQRGWLTRFQLAMLAQGRGKELVLGPYRLLDRVGEGAMGQVFKAHHQPMNRTVALKVIRKECLAKPDAVKRFYREVQAAARLSHPNIVAAYDAGQAGDTHYFAMEYVEGVDLARLVKQTGPLPVAQACDFVRQAALGLEHAYEQGMVHRDVKPHNLLVTQAAGKGRAPKVWRGAVVKVLDLGLARLQGLEDGDHALTKDGAVMGTPEYLAPEQALDAKAADVRSDLYGLGCTLYFLLVGKPPFHGETLAEMLLKHQMGQAVPLEQARSDVPAGLGAVVSRLMAKRPDDRYQTPAELAQALGPFCDGAGAVPMASTIMTKPANESESLWASVTEGVGEPPARVGEGRARTGTTVLEAVPASSRLGAGKLGGLRPLHWTLIGGGAGLAVLIGALVAALGGKAPDHSTSGHTARKPEAAAMRPEPATEHPAAERPPAEPAQVEQPVATQPTPQPAKAGSGKFVKQPPVVSELRRFQGHTSAVTTVALSPDGRLALSGGKDNTVRVWDLQEGKQVRRLDGHTDAITAVAFAPDGRYALSASKDHSIRRWDLADGREAGRFLKHTHAVLCLALSRDGRRAVSGGMDDVIRIWDVATGKEQDRVRPTDNLVQALDLSPDGRRILWAGVADNMVHLTDLDTKQEVRTFGPHKDLVTSVAFSPDGRSALSGSVDGIALMWDLETGRPGLRFSGGPKVTCVAFTRDGSRTLIATGSAVMIGDPVARVQQALTSGPGRVLAMAVSADGRSVLTGGDDGAVRLWGIPDPVARAPQAVGGRAPEGEPEPAQPRPAPKAPVPDAAKQAEALKLVRELFQEDYAKVTPGGREELAGKLIDKAAQTDDDPTSQFVLLREARDVAAAAGQPRVAFRAIDEMAKNFIIDVGAMKAAAVAAAASSAVPGTIRGVIDGYLELSDNAVARDDFDNALRLIDKAEAAARQANNETLAARVGARAREVREVQKAFVAARPACDALKKDPDNPEANLAVGKFLCLFKGDWAKGLPMLAKGSDKDLRALVRKELEGPADAPGQAEAGDAWWDRAQTESGVARLRLQARAYHWYESALPGVSGLMRARLEKRLKLLEQAPDFRKGDHAGASGLYFGHTGPVLCLSVSGDGRQVLSGGADGTARLWDVASGTPVRRLSVGGEVHGVALLPGGRRALAGGSDGLSSWDLATGRKLVQMVNNRKLYSNVAVTADGSLATYGGADSFNETREVATNRARGGSWSTRAAPRVVAVACSSDGDCVAYSLENKLVIVHGVGINKVAPRALRPPDTALGIAFSPDRSLLLAGCADGTIQAWDPSSGDVVGSFKGHAGPVDGIAFSPDGRQLLSGGADRTVRLWDVKTRRELQQFKGHTAEVRSVAFLPDGRRAVSAGDDRSIRLWSLR